MQPPEVLSFYLWGPPECRGLLLLNSPLCCVQLWGVSVAMPTWPWERGQVYIYLTTERQQSNSSSQLLSRAFAETNQFASEEAICVIPMYRGGRATLQPAQIVPSTELG